MRDLRLFVSSAAFLASSIGLSSQVDSTKICHPFFSNTLYLPNENPNAQIGDFNDDGIPDLAGVTLQDVHILLGNGNGAFRDAGTFPVGKSAGGLAVGDFNHDGKLDVAAALEDGTVNVLLGNGDGTFQAPKGSHIHSYTGTLAVGDFNHDGKLDLVGIPSDQFEKSVIQVLLGNGDGTFQPPVDYTVNANPRSIAVADFNHDGKLDLAVSTIRFEADPGHIVSVLLGNGDGTF